MAYCLMLYFGNFRISLANYCPHPSSRRIPWPRFSKVLTERSCSQHRVWFTNGVLLVGIFPFKSLEKFRSVWYVCVEVNWHLDFNTNGAQSQYKHSGTASSMSIIVINQALLNETAVRKRVIVPSPRASRKQNSAKIKIVLCLKLLWCPRHFRRPSWKRKHSNVLWKTCTAAWNSLCDLMPQLISKFYLKPVTC